MNKEHAEYLAGDDWRKRRNEVFSSQGRKCLVCGVQRKLNVHHIHYQTHGKESIEHDLAVLCEQHHKEYHDRFGSATRAKFYLFLMGCASTKTTKKITVKKTKKVKRIRYKKPKLNKQQARLKALGLKPHTEAQKRKKVVLDSAVFDAIRKESGAIG